MKPIPQMFTDETLRARYREALQRKSVLSPQSHAGKELEEEIADLVQEHRRRGLHVQSDESQNSVRIPNCPPQDPLQTVSAEVLRAQFDEVRKKLCTISERSKLGKQLKRELMALEHEHRRRGLPLPIDSEVVRLQ